MEGGLPVPVYFPCTYRSDYFKRSKFASRSNKNCGQVCPHTILNFQIPSAYGILIFRVFFFGLIAR